MSRALFSLSPEGQPARTGEPEDGRTGGRENRGVNKIGIPVCPGPRPGTPRALFSPGREDGWDELPAPPEAAASRPLFRLSSRGEPLRSYRETPNLATGTSGDAYSTPGTAHEEIQDQRGSVSRSEESSCPCRSTGDRGARHTRDRSRGKTRYWSDRRCNPRSRSSALRRHESSCTRNRSGAVRSAS